jgi:hypothetical protein
LRCAFPNQTRDSVEILFHDKILIDFPSYGTFWEEFIGIRLDSGLLKPYTLNLTHLTSSKHNVAMILHERISMAHYSIFCQLASAHRLLEELCNCKTIQNEKELHFKHWQILECAYLCIGTAWQEVIILWDFIFDNFKRLEEEKDKNRKIPSIKIYFNPPKAASPHPAVWIQLQNMQKNIINFRNEIAHVSRSFSKRSGKEFKIPTNFQSGQTWNQQQLTATSWILTSTKLENDLIEIEKTFEATHLILINEFKKILKSKNISIDYSTGQQDVLCSNCHWWTDLDESPYTMSSGSIPSTPDASSAFTTSLSVSIGSNTMEHYDTLASGLSSPIPSIPNSVHITRICQNPKCGKVNPY